MTGATLLVLLALVPAASGRGPQDQHVTGPRQPRDPPPAALARALSSCAEVRAIELQDLTRAAELAADLDAIAWEAHSRELPAAAADPAVKAGMMRFLEGGGGLLLLSHAASWAVLLGLEPRPPDRCDTRLIGHSDRRAGGRYEYGLRAVERSHELFAGLVPHGGREDSFLLAGGAAVRLECCFWERSPPLRGRTLATWYRDRYGEAGALPHHCLVELVHGRGRVLVWGAGPLELRYNPHRENLLRFLANCAHYLGAGRGSARRRPRIGILPATAARLGVDAYSSRPPPPRAQPPWWQRPGPNLPYIAHWGWLAPIDYQRRGRRSASPRMLCERTVREAARWGANLLEFYAPDMERGFPFTWRADDPIPRPAHYWGGAFDPLWSHEEIRRLSERAHAWGMLVHSFHHPNPVRGAADNFEHFAELCAREFSNPLLHGWRRAWDGFGSEWFPAGCSTRVTRALWRTNPGAYQHSTSILPAFTPNFSATLMCAFGRLGGLNACGFSDQWRALYHPPLYLSYQADCRSRKPSTRDWGSWARYGGGSYPDWILRQVNDFCRERLDLDDAIWWLGEPAASAREEYRDYVYGISMDPIRCAVSCGLLATGRGGYREVLAALVPQAPPGFSAGAPFPLDSSILQNNHLRLVRRGDRDRGVLLLDPLHLARFDPDRAGAPRALVLASDLLSSSLVGWRPRACENRVLALGSRDASAGEGRSSGGYERRCEVGRGGQLPARIAYERDPRWPGEVEVRFIAPRAGRHALILGQLAEESGCLVEVELDGRPVGFYATREAGAPRAGAARIHTISFPIVRRGAHRLVLRVQDGAGHALDFLEIRRLSDWAIEHEYPLHAGVRALLRETIARETPGGLAREIRTYRLEADGRRLAIGVRLEGAGAGPTTVTLALDPAGAQRLRFLPSWGGAGPRLGADGAVALPLLPGRSLEFELALGKISAPRVEVREIAAARGQSPRPQTCFVRELDREGQAWWSARGAQRAGAVDLVKLYSRAASGESAAETVRTAAWLPSGFRPAWGCQHALAIAAGSPPETCVVRVVKCGPFLFAPRVEYREALRAVRLDGADWCYFEEGIIFLPNRPGTYRLEVTPGRCEHPTLTRTALAVRACTWDAASATLRIESEAPARATRPLPGGLRYTAALRSAGRRMVAARGCELIPESEYRLRASADRETMRARGCILRLQPGIATLRFER